jgi:hypothetical protein
VRYWNEKYTLFGEDHTFGPLTIQSLQLKVIENGGFTILPKDTHGRIVIHRHHVASQIQQNGSDSVVRTHTYITTIQSHDTLLTVSYILFVDSSPFLF